MVRHDGCFEACEAAADAVPVPTIGGSELVRVSDFWAALCKSQISARSETSSRLGLGRRGLWDHERAGARTAR